VQQSNVFCILVLLNRYSEMQGDNPGVLCVSKLISIRFKVKSMKAINTFLLFILWSTCCFSQTGGNVTSKYDFVPGEKVIFYDDFSSEKLGDFPAQWLTNGSGEIVSLSTHQGPWFQISQNGYYIPEAKDLTADNYTVEFDMVVQNHAGGDWVGGVNFCFLSAELANPSASGQPGNAGMWIRPDYDNIFWTNWSEAREWQGDEGQVSYGFKAGEKYRISFWIQKQRVRMYVNETKVMDLPRGLQANYSYTVFRIEDVSEETTALISGFRIAEGLPDTRSKLLTEGRMISYGIYFDVNSDRIKPASAATIKDIARVLTENPTLRISIVGHTDSDGDDAANLDLSKRRAASVKAELLSLYNIEPSRIETDGKGETQALVPNNNPLNKAKNRRVELIRL
jgi:OmpA-OmpF porin, OOP family